MRSPALASSAWFLLVLFSFSPLATPQDKKLTLEQAMGGGERVDFNGRAPSWRWAADGKTLVDPDGKGVDPATGKERKLPDSSGADERDSGTRRPNRGETSAADRDRVVKALSALDGIDEALAKRMAGRARATSADGAVAVYVAEDTAAVVHDQDGARLLDLPPGAELLDLSSNGRHLAFVHDNDLHAVHTGTGAMHSLTTDGSTSQLNGKLDWVYQEEVYGRGDFKAHWWSPDGAYIAFLSLDESAVHDFTVVDHIEPGTFRVKAEVTHYPKAGDPNPTVRFGVANVATGKTAWADLAKYEGTEPLVVRVDWTPAGDRVLFVVQDRIQQWADLNRCDPKTGQWETMIHEENDSWTERPVPPRWLTDGTFLWFSHRTDYQHLYHYQADGTLLRAVTSGDWAFGRLIELDEAKGLLYFTATKDGAVNGNVYRIGLDGKGLTRLTRGEGQHSLSFNDDHSYFLDRWSSLAHPSAVRLCRGSDGEIVRELGTAEIPAAKEYPMASWELVEVKARDGYAIDAAVMNPVPFDPDRPHPVWISTYSGPDAATVRNRWSGSVWDQFLAQQGFVQLQLNVRSASGKGHWAIEQCYKQLGVSELRDIEDAVDWLCANPWADAARVGITGHSYGGFMTAFALTHSDKFALGIAGSGVYDWGMYDTIYTERYMSTPQLNPDGYAKASVIAAAKDLHGHLVITHGVMDDNVHVQNAYQLIYELEKAKKMNFSLMLYPQSRHGVAGNLRGHNRMLEWETMQKYLIAPGP